MDTSLKEMSLGIQDFEKLRKEECVYVDKTQYVYALTRKSRPFFLARPRQFGKSLFISTLKAFFLGKKHLFEGLAIAELEKDWIEYPVIYIDFTMGSVDCLKSVEITLNTILNNYERQWGITEKYSHLSSRLSKLIETAYEKSGKSVVVLVDEYDRPLVRNMNNPKTHKELCNFLKGFYCVLKGMDYALRFVFLTGVTKFSRWDVFYDMNLLIDISFDEEYAGICGFSETELFNYFEPEIQSLAKQNESTYDSTFAEIKKRYDGYRFAPDGTSMYNPFSLLNVFNFMDFGYYWFVPGTITSIAKTLRNNHFDIRKLDNDVSISVSDIDEDRLTQLLYQTGYLTIKSYDASIDAYTLGFPNEEVKYGFLDELLPAFIPGWGLNDSFSIITFIEAVESGNVVDFMNLLRDYYAAIPYDLKDNRDKDEQYYQLICYLLFTLMGQFVETEVKSAQGRADVVVKTVDSIYVFEFKMEDNATAEEALAQIDKTGYLIPYTADHRRLVKIGVEFSKEAKGLKRWVVE